ncbi:hypothetical protein LPJ79_001720 [Coemansia sp. RSA 1821]|nr:hypothetical protein LPJ68_001154 [Coemansia sp. RSA 1086]KAJ1751878.1 hypothetical protein LPJ79_001720 [Coemansia sp. RSA 1821]
MVELNVTIDNAGAQCMVYKTRGSRMQGKLMLKTSDKLKVRQISIRLLSTELVDFHTKNPHGSTTGSNGGNNIGSNNGMSAGSSSSGAGGGLHSYLQKSSKTIGTWMILEKKSSAHVLAAGKHSYSFEIPLPKGLDGSIKSKTYTLQYELETRLEYSFKLKPDLTHTMPVELVQVPMASNLQSDDRISLKVVPGRAHVDRDRLSIVDVPLGRALCLDPDVITQKECFVLHHLWDEVLSLRVRLPHGRVFPVGDSPVLDIEAVPLARNHRCTAFRIALEEISIIARPQRVGILSTRSRASAGDNLHPRQPAEEQTASSAAARRSSASVSHLSSSSEDSLPASSHNAWAYAQECSSAYDNAITRVRELCSTSTKWTRHDFPSLSAFHGILTEKLNLAVPSDGTKDTNADLRNSHIQIHHQLVYELEYAVVGSEMVDMLRKEPRVRAAAHIYNSLGKANIVRRDEIRDDRRPGSVYTVRGTLPVVVVTRNFANFWGIRDISLDTRTGLSPVEAAVKECMSEFPEPNTAAHSTMSMPLPSMPDAYSRRPSTELTGTSAGTSLAAANTSSAASAASSHHSLHNGRHNSSGVPAVLLQPPPAGFAGPSMETCSIPQAGSGYPPMGFMAQTPPASSMPYPPQQQDTSQSSILAIHEPPSTSSVPSAPASAGGMAYDPMMFQRQIEMFQEQQRRQQEEFFKQLTEQYARMVASQQQPAQNAVNMPPSLTDLLGSNPLQHPQAPPSSRNNVDAADSSNDIYAVLDIPTGNNSHSTRPSNDTNDEQSNAHVQASFTASIHSRSSSNLSVFTAEETSNDVGVLPEVEAASAPAIETPIAEDDTSEETTTDNAAESVVPPPVSSSSANDSQQNGRSSPPPSYDDILPPEYEVPSHQPPPYRPLDRNSRNGTRSRR